MEEEKQVEINSITMTINAEVINVLQKYSVNIGQMFILLSLYDGAHNILARYASNSLNSRIMWDEYHPLVIHGFIKESKGVYELEERGKTFVESVRILFEMPDEGKQTDAMIRKLALEYLELWPKIKLPSGVYARVSSVEIEKKLKYFYNNYRISFKKQYGFKLTPEDILEATKSYVARYAKQGYNYMVNSSYFIQKKDKSSLADEMIAIKQGTIKQENKWLKQL